MARQERLAQSNLLEISAIVDEAELRRPVGDSKTMSAQLNHLIEMARPPNVTLQVLPFSAGAHPGMMGASVLMDFPEPFPPVVYIENAAGNPFLEDPQEVRRYSEMYSHCRRRR